MSLDTALLGYAFTAGALSFFSPCSVGLLPAYIGYFLGADERLPTRASGAAPPASGQASREERLANGVFRGAAFGLMASLGFFLLFLAVGLLVAWIGTRFLGPHLVWVSRVVGVLIVLMGILLLFGRNLTLTPRLTFSPTKSKASLFVFGVAYALVSLGCTLPIFLSVVLGSFAASSALSGLATLVAYATGMGVLMIGVSALLGGSREVAQQFLRRIVPHVKIASALIMILAGGYVLYYYTVVIA